MLNFKCYQNTSSRTRNETLLKVPKFDHTFKANSKFSILSAKDTFQLKEILRFDTDDDNENYFF